MIKNRQFSLILLIWLPLLLPAQKSTNRPTKNGTDPTEPRTRIDINIAEAQFISSGDLFATRVNGDFAFTDWISVGMGVPYYYAALPSATVSGIGDISVGFLLSFMDKNNKDLFQSIAFGFDMSLSSGDPESGTGLGQYIAIPYLAAAFYPADDIMVAPIIQEYYSFGKDAGDRRLNEMSFRIRNVLSTEDGHWLAFSPEVIIDYEGIYRTRYMIRTSLGYMFDSNWAISGDFVAHLLGDERFSSIGRFNLRYLFTSTN
ncbi:MAG TPA: hypothetical protein EYP36_11460 [Calditrichaeota bacterium]|nr:hypothetical protein [Calditrichota bacterium]